MKLRITRPAGRQLNRLLVYLGENSPQGERHVEQRITKIFDLLVKYPLSGQDTKTRGVRRMIATPYPYAVTYKINGE